VLAGKIPSALQRLAQDVVLREEFECLLVASASAQLEQWALEEAWRGAASTPAPASAQGWERAGAGHRVGQGDALMALEVLVQGVAQEALCCAAQWVQQPELAFALALRMARASVDGVEGARQPALERGGLGAAGRARGVAACPRPGLPSSLPAPAPPASARCGTSGQGRASGSLEEAAAAALWLHAVDQALSFDRIVAALVSSDAAAARASGPRHRGAQGPPVEASESSLTGASLPWTTAGGSSPSSRFPPSGSPQAVFTLLRSASLSSTSAGADRAGAGGVAT